MGAFGGEVAGDCCADALGESVCVCGAGVEVSRTS